MANRIPAWMKTAVPAAVVGGALGFLGGTEVGRRLTESRNPGATVDPVAQESREEVRMLLQGDGGLAEQDRKHHAFIKPNSGQDFQQELKGQAVAPGRNPAFPPGWEQVEDPVEAERRSYEEAMRAWRIKTGLLPDK